MPAQRAQRTRVRLPAPPLDLGIEVANYQSALWRPDRTTSPGKSSLGVRLLRHWAAQVPTIGRRRDDSLRSRTTWAWPHSSSCRPVGPAGAAPGRPRVGRWECPRLSLRGVRRRAGPSRQDRVVVLDQQHHVGMGGCESELTIHKLTVLGRWLLGVVRAGESVVRRLDRIIGQTEARPGRCPLSRITPPT